MLAFARMRTIALALCLFPCLLTACGQPLGFCADASESAPGTVRVVGTDTYGIPADRVHTAQWTCREISQTLSCAGTAGSTFQAKLPPYIPTLREGDLWGPRSTAVFSVSLYEIVGGSAVSVRSANTDDTVRVSVVKLPTVSMPGEVVVTGDLCNDDTRYPGTARFATVHMQLVLQ